MKCTSVQTHYNRCLRLQINTGLVLIPLHSVTEAVLFIDTHYSTPFLQYCTVTSPCLFICTNMCRLYAASTAPASTSLCPRTTFAAAPQRPPASNHNDIHDVSTAQHSNSWVWGSPPPLTYMLCSSGSTPSALLRICTRRLFPHNCTHTYAMLHSSAG